ncbi:MUC1 protein, partial [Rostratula benghalensis]|nr:MUC1 protein [Rostratula benghalensis]
TETTTTETTTTETTAETTATPMITAPNITIFKTTTGNRNQTSVPSHPTVFPATGNTTNIQSSNSSAGNTTAKSTTVLTTVTSHTNATTNDSSWITPINTNTTNSSSAAPTFPTGAATGIPISSTRGNGSSSASSSPQVNPTEKTSATTQGSTAPGQPPTAMLASSSGPSPSRVPAPLPTGVQLLRRVPLSFRIINRSFNESLRDPTSKEYRRLSHTVLTMYEYVFNCASCMGRQTYKGCSELQFSQGSVEVQSVLIFGLGNNTITNAMAEQQLRKNLDDNGFIMDLQLASIQSEQELWVTSPAPVPAVPDWAIALLVLVCILLLLSILTCCLMVSAHNQSSAGVYLVPPSTSLQAPESFPPLPQTTCTCRRKSRGKLDLLSTKDSYHPMAEYPPYKSHGRYVPPNSKPNPYSQVAGNNAAGAGTFTYTNPAATADSL